MSRYDFEGTSSEGNSETFYQIRRGSGGAVPQTGGGQLIGFISESDFEEELGRNPENASLQEKVEALDLPRFTGFTRKSRKELQKQKRRMEFALDKINDVL
jgi:hypothetical protein